MSNHKLFILQIRNICAEKKKEHLRKKVCSCCEGFCSHTYSTDLIRQVFRTSEW